MRKPLILLVDDDEGVLKVLCRHLEADGYEVATAPDGDVALEVFHERRPDLVLMDLRMSRLDGLAVMREMLDHDGRTPILICSGKAMESQVKTVLDEGAREFVAKPIDLPRLSRSVRKHLVGR